MSRQKKEYMSGQSRGGGNFPRFSHIKKYEKCDKPIKIVGLYPYGRFVNKSTREYD